MIHCEVLNFYERCWPMTSYSQDPDNNTLNLSLPPLLRDSSNYNLNFTPRSVKIDRIDINLAREYSDLITEKLFSLFSKDDFSIEDGFTNMDVEVRKYKMYDRFRKFTSKTTNNSISILYNRNKHYFPLLSIQIDDPNEIIIDALEKVQQKLDVKFKLAYLELAFDFPYDVHLHRLLKNNLVLKYNRGVSYQVGENAKSTYHGTRRNSRSSIIYPKEIMEDQPILRLELRFKGTSLKTFNLYFPDLLVQEIDLHRVFDLKCINTPMLHRHIIKINDIWGYLPEEKWKILFALELDSYIFAGNIATTKYNLKNSKYKYTNFSRLMPNLPINDLFHEQIQNSLETY